MNSEKGQALPLALLALAVGMLVISPFMRHASISLISSQTYGQAMTEQYSADAGVEHAIWRVKYEPGFAESLTADDPTEDYLITVNYITENIEVTLLENEPPIGPPPTEGTQAWRIEIAKSVEPDSAPLGELATFTYTIYIDNVGTSTVHLYEISDLLPIDFSYEMGSSSGVTTTNPTIELQEEQEMLTWAFSPPYPTVNSGETATQVFQATAILEEVDIYWNQAWVTGDPDSIDTVGTGSCAPVGGNSLLTYQIVSNGGGTTIRADVNIGDSGVYITSWEIE